MDGEHPLHADGLVTQIYHLLWKQDANLEVCRGVWIPDTVVYENDLPRSLFVVQGRGAQVELKRKVGKDLDSKSLVHHFARSVDEGVDVVACYMSKKKEGAEASEVTVEFLTAQDVETFINKRQHKGTGVLQRMLMPRGGSVAAYQVIWTPRIVMIEKRVNKNKIQENRVPAFERCATFEGPSHLSHEVACPAKHEARIRQMCDRIVKHVQGSERITVSRMVCCFKTDLSSNLFFAFASSVRLADSSVPLNLSPNFNPQDRERRRNSSMHLDIMLESQARMEATNNIFSDSHSNRPVPTSPSLKITTPPPSRQARRQEHGQKYLDTDDVVLLCASFDVSKVSSMDDLLSSPLLKDRRCRTATGSRRTSLNGTKVEQQSRAQERMTFLSHGECRPIPCEQVQSDSLIARMIQELDEIYYQAYSHFLRDAAEFTVKLPMALPRIYPEVLSTLSATQLKCNVSESGEISISIPSGPTALAKMYSAIERLKEELLSCTE
jgi:hypothetical protein